MGMFFVSDDPKIARMKKYIFIVLLPRDRNPNFPPARGLESALRVGDRIEKKLLSTHGKSL
jgi:hypothetical protein